MSRSISVIVAVCVCTTVSIAQSPQSAEYLLGNGISIRGGVGHLAIRDRYISDEKYAGTSSAFSLTWLRSDSSSAYRLGVEYAASPDVKNNNVSANVMLAGLNLDFLHTLGRFQLFAHDVFAYAGPSTEIFLYSRQQHIATGGTALFNAYSFALFFSLNANSTLVVPLSSDVSAESSARLALLSLAGRLPDLHEQNAAFYKFVSLFSGLRGHAELLLRYRLNDFFMLKAGYRFEICQSTSWDDLLSASDNLVFIVAVHM